MEDHNANPVPNRDIDDLIDTVERRTSERRPPVVEPTFVWVSLDRRIQGRLIDKSDAGIGVLVSDCHPFEIGFQVRVELGDERRPAAIMHVTELEPDLYRLGLAWE
jgi:hypothetical protein